MKHIFMKIVQMIFPSSSAETTPGDKLLGLTDMMTLISIYILSVLV